jgi:glucose/mannose-6-phosphate isomerase
MKSKPIENLCIDEIKKYDASDMYSLLSNYWKHIETAIKQANSSDIVFKEKKPDEILILGIGGSAMSGELLSSYLKNIVQTQLPKISLNRDWDIPKNISKKTWVFVCSYSGNTEETLSAFEKIQKHTDNIIAITSGGKLEEICNEKGYQVLKMPTGMMPRCAMFYSFFHLLFTFVRHKIIRDDDLVEFSHSIDVLYYSKFNSSLDYSVLDDKNYAIKAAKLLVDKIPLIYTTQPRLEAVNLRWRGQIQENANQMCFGNFVPELNHNEINGWVFPNDLLSRFAVIAMKDVADSKVLQDCFDNTVEMLEEKNITIITIPVEGRGLLERLVGLICLADWVSFYLAIFNEVDPTPIPEIAKLKAQQKKI